MWRKSYYFRIRKRRRLILISRCWFYMIRSQEPCSVWVSVVCKIVSHSNETKINIFMSIVFSICPKISEIGSPLILRDLTVKYMINNEVVLFVPDCNVRTWRSSLITLQESAEGGHSKSNQAVQLSAEMQSDLQSTIKPKLTDLHREKDLIKL